MPSDDVARYCFELVNRAFMSDKRNALARGRNWSYITLGACEGVFFALTKQTICEVVENELIDWDEVRKEFEETDITAKALADKYGIPSSTLHGRKKREKWKRKNKLKKSTDEPGGQFGNDNASGHGAPEGNKNAVSHGLFANFLPRETLEIMAQLHTMTPAEMIWQNILIQYTAIIRAQKIMFVRDEQDNYSNVTGIKLNPMLADMDGNPVKIEENREWHMAYERHEKFMSAQSRAITTLSNLIKQFVTMADEDDERKLKMERLELEIEKLKLVVEPNVSAEDKVAEMMNKIVGAFKDD